MSHFGHVDDEDDFFVVLVEEIFVISPDCVVGWIVVELICGSSGHLFPITTELDEQKQAK